MSTTPNIAAHLRYADELKSEGNNYFRAGSWNEALAAYRSALGGLPPRKEKNDLPDSQNEVGDDLIDDVNKEVVKETPETELDKKCSKARAVLNANIAACYVKLGEHKEAVEACSQALLDDPEYVKVLQRRAASNETLGTWSSLSAAQEDYNTLLKILSESDSRCQDISAALQRLKPRIEAAQKRETAETLEKLKGFGNNILGRAAR
ncbi:hypothetical protein AX15_001144 [Amanita polypyramis BW_CC]|nr:hypothetical protein AX15_001144 [Amanita polypyramis BW_CC]